MSSHSSSLALFVKFFEDSKRNKGNRNPSQVKTNESPSLHSLDLSFLLCIHLMFRSFFTLILSRIMYVISNGNTQPEFSVERDFIRSKALRLVFLSACSTIIRPAIQNVENMLVRIHLIVRLFFVVILLRSTSSSYAFSFTLVVQSLPHYLRTVAPQRTFWPSSSHLLVSLTNTWLNPHRIWYPLRPHRWPSCMRSFA